MPDQKAIIGRLQTPVDENGERKDIFLRTTADAVIYKSEDGTESTLTEVVKEVDDSVTQIKEDLGGGTGGGSENPIMRGMDIPVISETEPEKSCLWLKPDSDTDSTTGSESP